MSTQKKIILTNKIPRGDYSLDGSMDLDNCYQQTVAELGLQQSKRDQIIAFYLTILGFVIPSVVSLEVGNGPKALAFLAMYIIGAIFCHVILRYRIYKEVYWIACRVISQMCNIKPERRTKKNIYILFYNALDHNKSSIVQYCKRKQKDTVCKRSFFRSMKRQLNSAETLLYETLALFSSFVGAIGGYYAWCVSRVFGVVVWVFLVYMFWEINRKYVTRLMALYDCIDEPDDDEKLKKLEATFAKAWMLHCYVDDVIEDVEEISEVGKIDSEVADV